MRLTHLKRICVSDQQDNPEIAGLSKVNAELSRSLGRCREMVEECRAKLGANSNELPADGEHEGVQDEEQLDHA